MGEKISLAAKLRRFWQGLTGSGVRSYDDPRMPGAQDGDPAAQANAEIQDRNRLRGSNPGS